MWLHGGALKAGAKDGAETPKIARALADDGIAVASVNYRLSPKATYPAYVEDSAAAVAWVRAHIADEAAPVFHCHKNTPPMLVLAKDHGMAARSEENEYLIAAPAAARWRGAIRFVRSFSNAGTQRWMERIAEGWNESGCTNCCAESFPLRNSHFPSAPLR